MDFIGFGLVKVSSQVCIITQDGELIERRIKTDREHISELLGKRASTRVLVESSTESEWVARYVTLSFLCRGRTRARACGRGYPRISVA